LKIDRRIPLIAKIETASAVQNIKSIVMEADGIMVARGDLGLHIDIEEVPQVQKQIIRLGQSAAKPVIIATQMLESMTFNVEPTRAEVTDVFNAIMDGCDAVMLSGETSYGQHPLNAIQVMNRIAKRAELWRQRHTTRAMTEQILLDIYDSYNADSNPQMSQIDDEIAHAVFNLANGIDCHLIACLTSTGATPRRVSRFRGHQPVVAGVSEVQVMQELLLSYGIHPLLLSTQNDDPFRDRMEEFTARLKEREWVRTGDILILTGGAKPWPTGGTNSLKVHIVP